MAEQSITITIDAEGKIQAETEGFKGDTCLKELEHLLADLVELEKITKRDEFYQQIETYNRQKIR